MQKDDNSSALQRKQRVFVLGLDGASFRILRNWCQTGQLPNLQKLIEAGTSGILWSTNPPITAAAWASFQTGKQPGQHGIFEFSKYIPGSYESPVIDGSAIQAQTIWEILDEAGKKSISINVPMTYPPQPLNGLMVAGLLSPNLDLACYPPELAQDIAREIPEYKFVVPVRLMDYMSVAEYASQLINLAENRAKLGIKLLQHEWDFFMLHFQATDLAQHAFWGYLDPVHPRYAAATAAEKDSILNFYKRLDSLIGEVLSHLDDDVPVIVMSDHGFGAISERFYVNEWLYQQGFLQISQVWKKKIVGWLVKVLQAADVFKLRRRIRPRGRAEQLQQGLTQSNLIDWSQTQAFALPGSVYARVYFNRQGREKEGIVDEQTAVYLAQQIKEKLLKLRHPQTNQPIIRAVHLKEEIYQGSAINVLPDMVIEPVEGFMIATELNTHQLIGAAPKFLTGSHQPDGILIAKGEAIQSNHVVENAQITDILPTILYLLGVAIPNDLDGRVLTDIFEELYLDTHEPCYIATNGRSRHYQENNTTSAEDDQVVTERLKSLGYLG